jgi:glycosyltransferase involved in cell wall biosynthesis
MELPVVDFLSPCYNHSKYILESLNSIKQQTYGNIRHIIIDDCSKDDSAYKIQKWIDEHEYPCTFIQHKVNKGISYTFNEFLEQAQGKYITSLATDDFIMPERTERFVTYLENHPDDQMIVSDCILVNDNSEIVNDQSSFLVHYTQYRDDNPAAAENFGTYGSLLLGNYIPSSIMLRRSIFEKVGYFNINLKVEDWDMWLRVSREKRIALYPEPLTYYRFHETNSVKNLDEMFKGSLLTFFEQEKYCNTKELKDVFKKAFAHWFLHRYKDEGTELDKIFHQHAPKQLFYNHLVKMKIRKAVKRMLGR